MRRSLVRSLAFTGLFAAACSARSSAAAQGDIACDITYPAGFTPSASIELSPPTYPREALNAWSEGFTSLEFTVTPHGEVRDVYVVDAIGAKEFVKASVKAVLTYRFRPAMRGGAPVAQTLRPFLITYLFTDSKAEADHEEFIDLFKRARRQLQDNRPDDAIATLGRMFGWRLNMYEQALGSYLLAFAYTQKRDWENARYHAEHATVEEGKYLDDGTKAAAREMVVKLRAQTGDLAGALCALNDVAPAARPPLAALEAEMRARLASDAPLVSDGKILKHPLADQPGTWRRKLIRRTFSFANIGGEVKSFRLACVTTDLDAVVDAEMQWTVPEQAGSCFIRVSGAPGATFKFVEEW
jgi:TonB family protein